MANFIKLLTSELMSPLFEPLRSYILNPGFLPHPRFALLHPPAFVFGAHQFFPVILFAVRQVQVF